MLSLPRRHTAAALINTMLMPFPARSLRYLHECLGCGSHLPPLSRSSVLRWLQESKQDWSSMTDLRAVLSRGDEDQDLSRTHDDGVIDRLVALLESGQLHVCMPAGGDVASRANGTQTSATSSSPARQTPQTTPQRSRPFPLPGMLPEVPKANAPQVITPSSVTPAIAAPTLVTPGLATPGLAVPGLGNPLQATPLPGAAQVPPEHTVVFTGAREEPAKPEPVNKPKRKTEEPAKPVLHWFTVALKAAPELKARPAWWPPAANSPVGYGNTMVAITLGGVSPPEQTLDAGGEFHVDLIPPGSAKVHFREFFAQLEPVFLAGTSF